MLDSAMPAAVAALRLHDQRFDALCQAHQSLDDEIDNGILDEEALRKAKRARLRVRREAEAYFAAAEENIGVAA